MISILSHRSNFFSSTNTFSTKICRYFNLNCNFDLRCRQFCSVALNSVSNSTDPKLKFTSSELKFTKAAAAADQNRVSVSFELKQEYFVGKMTGSGRNNDNTKQYNTVDELWKEEVEKDEALRAKWYKKAIDYWEEQDTSVNGVLGGFEETSAPDLKGSTKFIQRILALPEDKLASKPTMGCALDCGAG